MATWKNARIAKMKWGKHTDPNVVSSELAKLSALPAGLTPAAVVHAAADPASPLHDLFTWNDSEAAAQWRLHEARMLIVSIEVKQAEPEFVRVFVKNEADPKAPRTSVYVPMQAAMADKDLCKQILRTAKRELESYRSRYEAIRAMSKHLPLLDAALVSMDADLRDAG